MIFNILTPQYIKMSVVSNGVLLDEYFPDKSGNIVKKDRLIYSCTLNQTEIANNNNKFYIIQLIKTSASFILYTRYGRVGERGRSGNKQISTEEQGIREFNKTFKSKTGNVFGKTPFNKIDGKYNLAQLSYEKDLIDVSEIKPKFPESKLNTKVQELLKMLSNFDMMNNTMINLNIDVKRMPLGKLDLEQLNKANDILKTLEPFVKDKIQDRKQIIRLSSDYYTLIPYACGRNKPPLIDNTKTLDSYKNMIDELSQMVLTKNIINSGNEHAKKNPLDNIYQDLDTKIEPLPIKSEMYSELVKYVNNTHGPTHGLKLKVLDIYSVDRSEIKEISDDNRMLLFHGTPQSSVLSIFRNDFYLNPEKCGIAITGKMFGYGVYFADMVTKSFNYTRSEATNGVGCLLVCEVNLGKILEKENSDSTMNTKKITSLGYDSVKGIGQWAPSEYTEIDGVKIPNKNLTKSSKYNSLYYNEYIVYDISQIKIRYLILVKN